MNLDAIKKRLQELQSKGAKGEGSKYKWKPEEGSNEIRILPYMHKQEDPFLEIFYYYPSKPDKPSCVKKTTVSPVTFGAEDPIVEFAERLRTNASKEDWLLGTKMLPTKRYMVPVLVRGKEKEGPKFWEFGNQVYASLLNLLNDSNGEVIDLETGHDIIVHLTKGKGTNDFDKTTVSPKLKPSVVTTDSSILALIKKMPKIEEFLVAPTYDSLKDQLQEWLKIVDTESDTSTVHIDVTDDNTTEEVEQDGFKESKVDFTVDDVPSTVDDVEEQFAKLFNK